MKKRAGNAKFGQNLRQIRKQFGLSQQYVSKHAGISQGYLVQIERGEVKNPSGKVFFGLAHALNIDINDLFRIAGYLNGPTKNQELINKIDPEFLEFLAQIGRTSQRKIHQALKILFPEIDKIHSPS